MKRRTRKRLKTLRKWSYPVIFAVSCGYACYLISKKPVTFNVTILPGSLFKLEKHEGPTLGNNPKNWRVEWRSD